MTPAGPGRTVDLNADLGEGYGAWPPPGGAAAETALLGLVTSANIACGFHAGSPAGLRRTVAAAVAAGVVVGAQVGYPDLVGFGRRRMDIDAEDLAADVLVQVGALDALCRAEGTRVAYVKPHGALYHRVLEDPEQAGALVAAVAAYGRGLPLLTLAAGRAAREAAVAGVPVVAEAYADRAYTPDGGLVPRGRPGAVLTDPAAVAARAVRMVVEGGVAAEDGSRVPVAAASLCLHGDTPGAVALARAVRDALTGAGVGVAPFTPAGPPGG